MKIKPYILIYIIAAIIVATASIIIVKIQFRIPESIINFNVETITGETYSEHHYNTLILDTFIQLNKKAYGELITIDQTDGELIVSLKNTNKLGTDYYNNNSQLTSLKYIENGFEVINDEKNNIVTAKFMIQKNQFVNVPNDVIISLMYKVYNK